MSVIALLNFAALMLVSVASCYGAFITAQGRKRLPEPLPAPEDLFYVFMVPCLNEEEVIGKTLQRLTSLSGPPRAVMVIDDGSEDETGNIVKEWAKTNPNVWLLQRVAPNCRKGKGAALNNAFQYLLDSDLLDGRRLDDVIVGVVDADGRPDQNTLAEVAPFFRDPKVGACQIGVRMYNRDDNFLARMQDIEFVVFTEMFQKARSRVGSAGLGGNGQFTRLTTLMSLGDEPWSDYLTEDLELGINMLSKGWHNTFCPTAFVNQQAVTDFRRLVRQRTRWFQGQLQCWNCIPTILRSPLPVRVIIDLCYHLLGAIVMVLMSMLTLALGGITALLVVKALAAGEPGWILGVWWRTLFGYVFGFALAWVYAYLYWLRTPDRKFWRILIDTHLFNLYVYFWLISGLRAIGRIVTKKNGWAKTARTADAPGPGSPGAAVTSAGAPVSVSS
jgi:1,2-diacylglycerol 3-beta-glucosyltransferase